jgi:hypothetical protein
MKIGEQNAAAGILQVKNGEQNAAHFAPRFSLASFQGEERTLLLQLGTLSNTLEKSVQISLSD